MAAESAVEETSAGGASWGSFEGGGREESRGCSSCSNTTVDSGSGQFKACVAGAGGRIVEDNNEPGSSIVLTAARSCLRSEVSVPYIMGMSRRSLDVWRVRLLAISVVRDSSPKGRRRQICRVSVVVGQKIVRIRQE